MAWTQYKGKPVFFADPNWITNPTQGFFHNYDKLSFIGPAYAHSSFSETHHSLKASFLFESRERAWDMRSFFDDMMGRLNGFWMPSGQSDIIVTAPFLFDAVQMAIENIEYAAVWLPNACTGRHIRIWYPDGTKIYRAITGAPDSTTITIDTATNKPCDADQLPALLVSFLHFVRFDIDKIELNYITDQILKTKLSFYAIPSEAPGIG